MSSRRWLSKGIGGPNDPDCDAYFDVGWSTWRATGAGDFQSPRPMTEHQVWVVLFVVLLICSAAAFLIGRTP
jgi:hypothetical protein